MPVACTSGAPSQGAHPAPPLAVQAPRASCRTRTRGYLGIFGFFLPPPPGSSCPRWPPSLPSTPRPLAAGDVGGAAAAQCPHRRRPPRVLGRGRHGAAPRQVQHSPGCPSRLPTAARTPPGCRSPPGHPPGPAPAPGPPPCLQPPLSAVSPPAPCRCRCGCWCRCRPAPPCRRPDNFPLGAGTAGRAPPSLPRPGPSPPPPPPRMAAEGRPGPGMAAVGPGLTCMWGVGALGQPAPGLWGWKGLVFHRGGGIWRWSPRGMVVGASPPHVPRASQH